MANKVRVIFILFNRVVVVVDVVVARRRRCSSSSSSFAPVFLQSARCSVIFPRFAPSLFHPISPPVSHSRKSRRTLCPALIITGLRGKCKSSKDERAKRMGSTENEGNGARWRVAKIRGRKLPTPTTPVQRKDATGERRAQTCRIMPSSLRLATIRSVERERAKPIKPVCNYGRN